MSQIKYSFNVKIVRIFHYKRLCLDCHTHVLTFHHYNELASASASDTDQNHTKQVHLLNLEIH